MDEDIRFGEGLFGEVFVVAVGIGDGNYPNSPFSWLFGLVLHLIRIVHIANQNCASFMKHEDKYLINTIFWAF